MSQDIKQYFDFQSRGYQAASSSSLWAWQRKREARAVEAMLGPVKGQRVLDMGSGAGFYTRLCLARGASHVTAVDFSESMISQLPREKVTGIVADAAVIELDEQFEKILCAGLLEFAPSPENILRNIRKAISADGTFVCLVPPRNLAGRIYRMFHRRHGFEINLFCEAGFCKISRSAGWSLENVRHIFPYSSVYRLRPCLNK